MMKNTLKFLAAATMLAAAVSCASVEKMAKMAQNVKVTCEPGVLEVVDQSIGFRPGSAMKSWIEKNL